MSNTYLKDVDKLNDVRMTLAESKKLDLIGTINTARNYFDGIFLPCRSMHTTPANGKTTISKYCVMQINIVLAKKGRVLEKLENGSINLYWDLISQNYLYYIYYILRLSNLDLTCSLQPTRFEALGLLSGLGRNMSSSCSGVNMTL